MKYHQDQFSDNLSKPKPISQNSSVQKQDLHEYYVQKQRDKKSLKEYETISQNFHVDLAETPKDLSNVLDMTNTLLENVSRPSIFSKDLLLLKNMTEKAGQLASSFLVGNYTPTLSKVIIALKSKYGFSDGMRIDWEKLGEWSLRRSKVAPKMTVFFQGIESYTAQPRRHKPLCQIIHEEPSQMKEVGIRSQVPRFKALTEKATHLYEEIIHRQKMPLTEILREQDSNSQTNIESFTQVVQKAFQLSHLMSNGRVALTEDNDGEVVVENVKKEGKNNPIGRHQCILHLNYQDYIQMFQ